MDAGAVIRRVRESRGLTQRQLAIRAGTTQSAISRIERGEQSPTVDHLERLLAALGTRLRLETEDLEPWTARAHLDEFAAMTPQQRLRHGLAASRDLAGLLGAVSRA